MKNLIVAGLSALPIGALVSPTMASEVIAMKNNSPVIHQVAPVNLVQLGYQGYFKSQGIPSAGLFATKVAGGDITAETLVKSTIEKGRLSPDTLNDSGYLNIVQRELDGLNRG